MGPSRGSHERKRIAACLIRRSDSMRSRYIAFSTDVPIHTLRGHGRSPASSAAAFGAFGQHLEVMLRTLDHHIEHALNELRGNILVKEIAHRVDENALRLRRAARQVECVFVGVDLACEDRAAVAARLAVPMYFTHPFAAPHASRQTPLACVAVQAAGRHGRTPSYGVPRGLCPFDA